MIEEFFCGSSQNFVSDEKRFNGRESRVWVGTACLFSRIGCFELAWETSRFEKWELPFHHLSEAPSGIDQKQSPFSIGRMDERRAYFQQKIIFHIGKLFLWIGEKAEFRMRLQTPERAFFQILPSMAQNECRWIGL